MIRKTQTIGSFYAQKILYLLPLIILSLYFAYPKIQQSVQEIIKLESGEDWTLYGKTGWTGRNSDHPIGWFVGWINKQGKIYSFAINIDTKDLADLPKREIIAKKNLKSFGLL